MMNLKELLDYGRGLEMSQKQTKGIEDQEKLAQVAELQTVKEEKRKPEMVSALDSGASGLGSSPGRGHFVVFLGKTLNSHGASLHPGV